MNKFNVGDIVRRNTSYSHNGMKENATDKVIEVNGYLVTLEKYGKGHDKTSLNLVQKGPEFQYGDKVEVCDYESGDYIKATFMTMNPDKGSEYKYIIKFNTGYNHDRFYGYKYCRKVQESVKEFTLQEIADKLKVPIDKLRIKD